MLIVNLLARCRLEQSAGALHMLQRAESELRSTGGCCQHMREVHLISPICVSSLWDYLCTLQKLLAVARGEGEKAVRGLSDVVWQAPDMAKGNQNCDKNGPDLKFMGSTVSHCDALLSTFRLCRLSHLRSMSSQCRTK